LGKFYELSNIIHRLTRPVTHSVRLIQNMTYYGSIATTSGSSSQNSWYSSYIQSHSFFSDIE
jgi:F0F1-type ATP synthase membrane subunit a